MTAALRPKTAIMKLDDGSADGKARAHPITLGCIKRLENSIGLSQSDAVILYFHADRAWIMSSCSQGQGSPAAGKRVHRIQALDAQVD